MTYFLLEKVLTSARIRNLLYDVIYEIGKEKIQTDITSNIKLTKKYIDVIVKKCIRNLGSEANDDETVGTLCEILLHFMLTISTLPSERKVRIKNNLILDLVIPNLQTLKKSPDKSLIIQVIKNSITLEKITYLEFLQPKQKNIWLISARSLQVKYINYNLDPIDNLYKYSDIILDIDNFLKFTSDKSFRFFHQ
jgi:hypothetical protein